MYGDDEQSISMLIKDRIEKDLSEKAVTKTF